MITSVIARNKRCCVPASCPFEFLFIALFVIPSARESYSVVIQKVEKPFESGKTFRQMQKQQNNSTRNIFGKKIHFISAVKQKLK